MQLHEDKNLATTLRHARALACELRTTLEAAEDLANESETEGTYALALDLGEAAGNVSMTEDFLDRLPINEDGTSAADGFEESKE